jgi:hypothetical protein
MALRVEDEVQLNAGSAMALSLQWRINFKRLSPVRTPQGTTPSRPIVNERLMSGGRDRRERSSKNRFKGRWLWSVDWTCSLFSLLYSVVSVKGKEEESGEVDEGIQGKRIVGWTSER